MGMSEYLGNSPQPFFTGFWPTDLANFSSFVFHSLPKLNWCGFYLYSGGKLQLGPFQGKPACMEIAVGKGVCGTSFQKRESILVPDVHAFPGHIACDSASRSELVIPLLWGEGEPWGVLDLDSPELHRFSEKELHQVEEWLKALEETVRSRHAQSPWKQI